MKKLNWVKVKLNAGFVALLFDAFVELLLTAANDAIKGVGYLQNSAVVTVCARKVF